MIKHNTTCILITGINGFLGSALALKLTKDFKIIGIEKSKNYTNKLEGHLDEFEIFSSSRNDLEKLFRCHKVSIIIHTATCFGKNNESISKIASTNYFFPLLLLEFALKYNVVYFINTDTIVNKLVNEYSFFKQHFLECLDFYHNRITAINVQLEHFYGEKASDANFVTLMIKNLLKNKKKIDLTTGEQKREFIYIEDVVDAFICIIETLERNNKTISNFHIRSGESISIKELMILLKKLTGSKSELKFGALPYRQYELMNTKSDDYSIKKLVWHPNFTLCQGLERTISFLRKREQTTDNI